MSEREKTIMNAFRTLGTLILKQEVLKFFFSKAALKVSVILNLHESDFKNWKIIDKKNFSLTEK